MKRLALLLVAVALLLPAAANAQLTMQMSNGWSFSFAGNVNAFWVFTKANNSGPANSSVRTGLLPAFATFEAKGREAGMNLAVHFGFAPQIQNAGVHDQFSVQSGAAIDMRQVYRSEEHTSELQSLTNLVCRLLLEKKKRQQRDVVFVHGAS